MSESCETCFYYFENKARGEGVLGECHRMPPHILPSWEEETQEVAYSVWPATRNEDWCGEYHEKDAEIVN